MNTQAWLVHPTGNQNVRHALGALHGAGILSAYRTALAWRTGSWLGACLPGALRREAERRTYPEIPWSQIHCRPGRELARLLLPRLGWKSAAAHESGWACVDAVYHDLDQATAYALKRQAPGAVYAYEDCALATFRALAGQGVRRIYELPIGHWRRFRQLMDEERGLAPEWMVGNAGAQDSAAKLERKDEELRQADLVVVPSSYVRDSLVGHPGFTAPVAVVPYGAPDPVSLDHRTWTTTGPLRLLFVGGINQRKGLSYLDALMRRLGNQATLTVIGRGASNPAINTFLARHRWIPGLPHAGVLAEMRQHDVLVFPTLHEGLSLATLEALAQGLAVVVTEHAGTGDVIRNGEEGFVVPIRNVDALADRVGQLMDRTRLRAMGAAALTAAARRSWAAYRRDWLMATGLGDLA